MGQFKGQGFELFKENKSDYYKKFSVESVLIKGEHRNPPPLVTILLTTYKRPELLKQALESSLNQIKFDDYQILVVDNEGIDSTDEVDTETSKLVTSYDDERIIYYRHKETVASRMDYASRLAKSKWICFLHDDDILASNHLYVMSRIVLRDKKIKYLSCTHMDFYGNLTKSAFHALVTSEEQFSYQIKRYPKSYTCLGYYPGWLGAFIDREAFISIGGMPVRRYGIGDYCMVGKFIYRYGIYELESNTPLYFYRRWRGQITAGGTEIWERLWRTEYEYHRYVTNVYHKFFRGFWNRISAYRILEKSERFNRGFYHMAVDLEEFVHESEMTEEALNKGSLYRRDLILQMLYEEMIKRFGVSTKYKGRI